MTAAAAKVTYRQRPRRMAGADAAGGLEPAPVLACPA
jgi:hypothetical protein